MLAGERGSSGLGAMRQRRFVLAPNALKDTLSAV